MTKEQLDRMDAEAKAEENRIASFREDHPEQFKSPEDAPGEAETGLVGTLPFSVPEGTKPKKRTRSARVGMTYTGQLRLNDLNNLPPLDIDADGYAMRPPAVSDQRRKQFSEDERKVRFLLMYNYSGAVIGLSCQEAGITRSIFEGWKLDGVFQAKLVEVHSEIKDRLQVRLNQRIGLFPASENVPKLHDAALFMLARKFGLDLPFEEQDAAEEKPQSSIPRPVR